MDSYIVRIYRRDGSFLTEPVGIVERPEDGKKIAFHGFPELLKILQNRKPPRVRKGLPGKSVARGKT
jgi:hypothetical protein